MNILFEFPAAFAAFAALPALLAIYLLRNRFRQVLVSSLMLWTDQRRHKQGGLNLDRLQTPLLFVLEFLILLLLGAAAVGPLLRSKSSTHRLVMVLDDSFSMQADSCRQTALEEIRRYLKESEPFQVTFIQAGPLPRVMAAELENMALVTSALQRWQCMSPAADLEKALAMAGQLAGRKARLIVISDHPPAAVERESRFEYWSFGRPLANIGFVHAERTRLDGRDRCLLTLSNFSQQTQTTVLTIQSLDTAVTVYQKEVEIPPDQPFQMIVEPPADLDLVASIPEDALTIDNQVILLKPLNKKVRTAVDLNDSPISESITNVLNAIPAAERTTAAPDLLITDAAISEPIDPALWILRIETDPNAGAFIGPFIVDRNHPLTEGLDLQGVIWSAAKKPDSIFVPIISAGNTTLLVNQQDPASAPRLRLSLNPRRSTLQQSPNWPILFWNLVHWRQQFLPGLRESNYRLGRPAVFQVPPDCSRLQLTRPDGRKENFDNPAETIVIETDAPGLYQLTAGGNSYVFAASAVSGSESDLHACRTVHTTNPDQAAQFWWEYRRIDWILLLLAAGLLILHRCAVWYLAKGGSS